MRRSFTYSGRAVMAEVAEKNGWGQVDAGPDPHVEGTDLVIYARDNARILVLWTPENTAVSIIKETATDSGIETETATGPLGLITARGWIEKPAT